MTKVRNALVFLPPTPKVAPADQAERSPTQNIIDGFTRAGAPRLGGIPAPLNTAKTVASSIDPLQVLRSIEHAALEIRVPGIPGKYGHGLGSFEIHPGTTMIMKAVVRDGRVVPEETQVDFSPAIDGPMWVSGKQIKCVAKGNDEFGIVLVLNGFPDLDLTKEVFGMDSVPKEANGLFALLSYEQKQVTDNIDGLTRGSTFDVGAFEAAFTQVQLRQGPVPLGSQNAALTLAPGSTIVATGNAEGLRIEGAFKVQSFVAAAGHDEVAFGPFSAHGSIFTTLDKTSLLPARTTVDFRGVNAQLQKANLHDEQESLISLGQSTVTEARIAFTTDLATLNKPSELTLEIGEIDARLIEAKLSVEQDGHRFPVALGAGRFVGEVHLVDGHLTTKINQSGLVASTSEMKLGQGELELGYSEASIRGSGLLDYDGHTARFAGRLELDGTIDEGRLGRKNGPLFVSFAKGTGIHLQVNEAFIGGDTRAFSGSGNFTAKLDAGSLVLPSGVRVDVGAGSTATIEAKTLFSNGEQMFAHANVHLDAMLATTIAPAALSNDAITITQLGSAVGRVTVKLDDVTYDSKELRIGSEQADVQATVSSVTGRLRALPKLVAPPKNLAEAKAATQNKSTSPIAHPSIQALAESIEDATVSMRIPVPAGSYGVWPLRFKVPANPPTTASFKMKVVDGKIDPTSVKLTFEPAIDGPLWVESRGMTVNKKGHFIAEMKGFPNVDISAILFGSVKMPTTFKELPAFGARLESIFQSTVGRIVPLPTVDASFDTLTNSGIDLDVTEVSLYGKKLSLGGDSYVIPGRDGRYRFTMSAGVAQLTGRGELLDARFADGTAHLNGVQGKADLSLSIRSDAKGPRVEGSISNLEGTMRCGKFVRDSGDRWHFNDARVKDSEISLTTEGGKLQVRAAFHSLDADMRTSRISTGESVSIDIPEGAFSGSVMVNGESVTGKGYVKDLKATLPATHLPLAGMPASISGGTITATGAFEIFEGGGFAIENAAADLAIDDGKIGDAQTPFVLQMTKGTTAHLEFPKLALGGNDPTTAMIEGRGNIQLRLAGGHFAPQNGPRLDIAAGSTGSIDLQALRWLPNQPFGEVQAALTIDAKVGGALNQGVTLANGATLRSVDAHAEHIRLSVGELNLHADGRFDVRKIALGLNSVANDVRITLA